MRSQACHSCTRVPVQVALVVTVLFQLLLTSYLRSFWVVLLLFQGVLVGLAVSRRYYYNKMRKEEICSVVGAGHCVHARRAAWACGLLAGERARAHCALRG